MGGEGSEGKGKSSPGVLGMSVEYLGEERSSLRRTIRLLPNLSAEGGRGRATPQGSH